VRGVENAGRFRHADFSRLIRPEDGMMDVRKIDVKNAATGLFLLTFSLFVYFFILPSQIEEPPAGPLALSPSLFCKVSAGLMIFLSILLTAAGVFRKREGAIEDGTSATKMGDMDLKKLFVTIGATALYIFMFEMIGYFVSTAAFMLFLMVFYGHRKWTHVISVTAIILSFIYVLFVMGLKVVLPEGIMI
jgi:putative tricarboxylic transport membrane protein